MTKKNLTKHVLVTDVPRSELNMVAADAAKYGTPLTYRIRHLIIREARRIERAEQRRLAAQTQEQTTK